MRDLTVTNNQLSQQGYWNNPLQDDTFVPSAKDLFLFDQNGYDLTELEKQFAGVNDSLPILHRSHRTALKQDWFVQPSKINGAILNHSLMFERKAYGGAALDQLKAWASTMPIVHLLIAIRPKWGLDFSIDWVDHNGNAFEVLHWEYDGFDYEEIIDMKSFVEPRLLNIDWDDAGKQILKHKDEWHHLGFFAQSDWKCNYFEIPKERFKMVIWK